MDPYAAAREEKWKVTVAELSQKLIQTTRKKDEAVLEASRLKYSMAELERKLNKLEVYCHGLKSGLDECSSGNSPYQSGVVPKTKRQSFSGFNDNNKAVVEHFLRYSTALSTIVPHHSVPGRRLGGGRCEGCGSRVEDLPV